MKKYILNIFRYAGYEIHRINPEYHYTPKLFGRSAHKLKKPKENGVFFEAAKGEVESRRTSLYYDRLYTIFDVLQDLKTRFGNNISIAEIGVYKGGGTKFIATVANQLFSQNSIVAIDTFEGHSEKDLPDGIEGEKHVAGHFGDTQYQDVAQYVSSLKNVTVVKSRIQDWHTDSKFHFIHLDVDIYAPTKHSLLYFGERMAKGGVIIVDDYRFISCPGVEQAVDEYCAQKTNVVKIPMLTGQCVLVFT